MKKSLIIIIIIVLGVLLWGKSTYNSMVEKAETVSAQWSNVENQYQRRLDLIPNLVNTVKGYAVHEKETLEAVIEARANASQTKIDFSGLDEASMNKINGIQQELSSALSRLMVVVERYPVLKANRNFLELQAQLEGTENRISVERRKFNETAKNYNLFIKRFPQNIFASVFGFKNKPYFAASAGAEKAPEVNF